MFDSIRGGTSDSAHYKEGECQCGDNIPVDACGICGGDNSSCTDCAGVPNGGAVLDKCGVCNGNNQCVDCLGVPNGTATIDCCGVCNGDGSTCLEKCTSYDMTSLKKKVTKNLNNLFRVVKKYSTQEKVCLKGRTVKAEKRILDSKKLMDFTLNLMAEQVVDTLKICDTAYCTKSSLVSIRSSLKINVKKLYSLARKAQYGAESACKTKKNKPATQTSSTSRDNAINSLSNIPDSRCE